MRIDPVHVGKRTSTDVMVDADQKAVFQALEAGPVNAVALQNDGRFVTARDATGLHHLTGARKRTVEARNPVVQHHIGLLAQGAQNLTAGQRRSHRVAVRAGVRGQHESLMLSDLPQHILNAAMPFFHWVPCGPGFFFLPAPIILRLAPFPAPRDPAGNTTPERAAGPTAPPDTAE